VRIVRSQLQRVEFFLGTEICHPQTTLWKNRGGRLGAPRQAAAGKEELSPGISEKNR
jgi:hypothetical protein